MSDAAAGCLEWKRLVRRFRTPVRTATGVYATRESLILRLTDAAGRAGYGEVAPWPGFPVETIDEAGRELRIADRGLRIREDEPVGYASPPCFLYELPRDFSFNPQSAIRNPQSGTCLSAALSHARAWIDNDWGAAVIALPCAALLRGTDDIAGALRFAGGGFRSLKLKIGRASLRDEQRAVSALVRALAGAGENRLRLDANGALDAAACAAWCEFLGEFPEVEWLEQPMSPGAEATMRDIAERSGVAGRLALDESACRAETLPTDWPGIVAVKPLLLGDLESWRARRAGFPPERVAYSSVFESPFGRQAALGVAGEMPGKFAVGFDTLGAFDDDLDIHTPGPDARSVSREPEFWDTLWKRIP